ncbi:outer membrane beta-barrel protein [Pontibacter sp. 13R65]|uniref:outer membrane beta-barrel protein n=1 Tax=Pontibacter sp. 13R65 TaxID=3127458 RepID=UPI00301BA8D7
MKKILLLTTCLMGLGIPAFSQDKAKGELNITFSKGGNEILRSQLEGAGSYSGGGFYGFGLSYLKPLNNWLDVEAGVNYQEYRIKSASAFDPDRGRSITKSNLHLVSIPLTVRANFLKHFFVNAGAVAEFETSTSSIDDQSGIGAMAGIGVKFNFTPKISAFVNPMLQQHAIIPFRPVDYQQRMLDAGVRLGIGMKL